MKISYGILCDVAIFLLLLCIICWSKLPDNIAIMQLLSYVGKSCKNIKKNRMTLDDEFFKIIDKILESIPYTVIGSCLKLSLHCNWKHPVPQYNIFVAQLYSLWRYNSIIFHLIVITWYCSVHWNNNYNHCELGEFIRVRISSSIVS